MAGRGPATNPEPPTKKKKHKKIASITRGRNPSPPESCAHFFIHFFFKHSFNFFFLIRTVGHRSQKNRRRGRSRGHLSNFSSPFTKRCAKKKDDNQTGENLKKKTTTKKGRPLSAVRGGVEREFSLRLHKNKKRKQNG